MQIFKLKKKLYRYLKMTLITSFKITFVKANNFKLYNY